MPSPLIIVSGVGTGIGKTHVSVALVRAWSAFGRIAGFKPVETGADPSAVSPGDDAHSLERASTFHVKHSERALRFRAPLSPHLAARMERRTIDASALADTIRTLREDADGVLVELPGGLFSPLTDKLLNVDFARTLGAHLLVLVAPDRLGVLNDVLAAARAAPDFAPCIVLNTPEQSDASTGTNAAELAILQPHGVLGPLPRAERAELAAHPAIRALIARAMSFA